MNGWLRVLLPALLAAFTAWVGVQVSVARLEEKISSLTDTVLEIKKDVLSDHESRIRDLEQRVRGVKYDAPR